MKKLVFALIVSTVAVLLISAPVLAQGETGELDSGDTTWILMCAALVMLMTPAVGLFYGGMVRKKNANSLIIQSFIILSLVSIQWVVLGYTLSFGSDIGGVIGGLEYAGLEGVGSTPNPDYAPTIPHTAFVIFQGMFAIITPVLVIGAFAERIKLSALILFVLLWCILVYDPIAHWVWGPGGWLGNLGALDFAGGTVVHISSGISALAAALIVGRRIGHKKTAFQPHNIPMSLLGGILLWFGWFGFNAGSALAADGLASNAFLVTNTAAAAAALTWMVLSWRQQHRPGALGIVTGGVAGLVAITPAAGFVGPLAAIVIGIGAGVFSFLAMSLRNKTRIDDSLDVWAIHGVSGTWGALATGIFASVAVNAGGANGLIYGNIDLFSAQIIAVVVTSVYAFTITFVLLKVIDRVIGLRVDKDEEIVGLDISQHGETAYN